MKNIQLFFLIVLPYLQSNGQCKEVYFHAPSLKNYTINDSIVFSAKNKCKNDKYVLFSLEFKDSTNEWQEIDNDIFTSADKGMKLVKLESKKERKFVLKINIIDSFFLSSGKKKYFRIIENLYSDDKVEIVKIKTVKEFVVQ